MSETTSKTVIGIDSLTVRYGRSTAVDGVSLDVGPGEVFALLGRNGSGKSSLVRSLLGLRRPDAGAARIFGRESFRHRRELAERLGVVPEEPDAPPAMSARELGRFSSRLYPRWDAAGYSERLERFGIDPKTRFDRLSRGQRSLVMLALALAPGPELLVLDDPTLGLDAVARRAVFEEVISELADRGITTLLTSHELGAVEGIASRVGFLDGGRLVLDEEAETLKTRFRRVSWVPSPGLDTPPDTFGRLAAGLEPRRVIERPWGFEAVVERFGTAAFAELEGDAATQRAEASALGLEEIFIALVGENSGDDK